MNNLILSGFPATRIQNLIENLLIMFKRQIDVLQLLPSPLANRIKTNLTRDALWPGPVYKKLIQWANRGDESVWRDEAKTENLYSACYKNVVIRIKFTGITAVCLTDLRYPTRAEWRHPEGDSPLVWLTLIKRRREHMEDSVMRHTRSLADLFV